MFTLLHKGGEGPPLVCIHGFMDTWRTWELVLPALEREREVLAPTLAGHAGGPPLAQLDRGTLADGVERAMDEAGFETAHVAGNSLGGYVALELAERGRARSVVALAPAGGWDDFEARYPQVVDHFAATQKAVVAAAPYADQVMATPAGRRKATEYLTTSFEHIPAELLAHQLRGAAACETSVLLGLAQSEGYPLAAERIECPLRFVWGTADRILEWPAAAERYRRLFPQADWVELDGVGHCPQLDEPAVTADLILGFTG